MKKIISSTNYEQYDNSGTAVKWIFWIVACFVFPPIAAFWMGWYAVTFALWLLRSFLTVVFTISYADPDDFVPSTSGGNADRTV
jgi:hypothetical protein